MRINLSIRRLLKTVLLLLLFGTAKTVLGQACNPKWNRSKSFNCVNSPIQFEANSPGKTTYEWIFDKEFSTGSGTTGPFQNPIHAFTTAGWHVVEYKFTNATGGSCNDTIMIFIKEYLVSFSSTKADSCNYGTVTLKNLSDTSTKLKDVAKFEWDFGDPGSSNNIITGDSVTNTQFYSTVKHRYDVSGKPSGYYVFNSKLTMTTKNGCGGNFTLKPTANIYVLNAKISADNDSGCFTNPTVTFKPIDLGTGNPVKNISSFLWNFGDPKTGPLNFDDKTLIGTTHNYTLGPWMVSLKLRSGPCNLTLFDTVTKIGPASIIEIPFSRIPENEKYQCLIRDSVHFTNNSLFYHNDLNKKFEDSSVNGKYLFKWPGDQTAIPSKFTPQTQRGKDNVLRLWDFGDAYAPKCTTDTKKNKNTGLNCRYSMDSLPVHWYSPWDQVYKYYNSGEFYSAPVEKTVLCKGGKFCYKVKYYRQQLLAISADTLVIVPKDSSFNYAGRSITPSTKEISEGSFRIKKVTSKFKGQASYTATLSDETWIFYTTGSITIKNINTGNKYTKGSGTTTLKKGDQFELKKGDSAILRPQAWISTGKTVTAQPTVICVDTMIGGRDTFIQRSRVFIDSNLHRAGFNLKYAQCYNVTLLHEDTVNAMRCKSSNSVSLALVAPNADGLTFSGISCYAPPSPPYGIYFKVDQTKPGCTQRLLKFNFDSAAGKNNWISHGGFLAPPLPGVAPWHLGYPVSGAYPTSFVKSYAAGDLAIKNPGWVTIGLIIGNGRLISGVPESMDTTWYHNAFRYLYLDGRFDIIQPEKDLKRVCIGDTISFKLVDPKMDSITQLYWNWNDEEGTYYEERSYYYKPYNGPNQNRNDKVIKDWKKGDKWLYNYVIRLDYNGFNYKILDTIVTGIMRKWSIAADISTAGEPIENAFKALGLNVREIPAHEIGMYFGNGTGKGCIDTTGMGKMIKFGVAPYRDALTFKRGTTWFRYKDFTKKDSLIISQKLHWRDSSHQGWDTLKQTTVNKYSGLKVTPGVYRHVYKKSGRYFPTFQVRNTEGCFQPRNKEVDVGFFWHWSFSDSSSCHGENMITLKDSIRYFAYEDPFEWLNPKKYWKDPVRYVNRRESMQVDFNEHDDTLLINRFGVTGTGVPPFSWEYDEPGVYTVRIAMKDSLGCLDTARQKVYITGSNAGFKLSKDANPCHTVSFTDSSRIIDPCIVKGQPCDEIVEYIWNFGDGTPQSKIKNPSHQYTKYGTFKVILKIITKLGCEDTVSHKVFISGPQPVFKRISDTLVCVGDSVIFDNLSKDPIYSPTWEWNFGDGKQLSHTGARKRVKHSYSAPGLYEVYLKELDDIQGSSQRCSATYPDTSAGSTDKKITVRVMICGKISKYIKHDLSIFPNPAYDHIFIKGLSKGEIVILDITGKEILRTEINNDQSIDISKLTKGTYFIRCNEGTVSYNGRLVKVL